MLVEAMDERVGRNLIVVVGGSKNFVKSASTGAAQRNVSVRQENFKLCCARMLSRENLIDQ